ncbi:MAG: GNAT family N-acetyltransferase [Candidatus Marinimicrobia bacterium]|nr:GNAT family N-acetyltransferase [Candidatus Neomarinimicrobiota bacterium]
MGINIKFVDNEEELDNCLSIRKKVFIEEQKISEEIELDDDHVNAISVCATMNEMYVGTARYRETSSGIKLERFAVLHDYRGQGIGKALVKFMVDKIDGKKKIYLHAQEAVVDFYLPLGFEKINTRFYEAGIPHWKMIKK